MVHIRHRRLACKLARQGCGRTFATFHPQFMVQLPTAVTEKFPFLVTDGGLGMHVSMIRQFICLCTKGILFSTFCDSINEPKMTRYWEKHANYLDTLKDHTANSIEGHSSMGFVKRPFPPYVSPGEYNGVLLKPGLVRKLFLQVCDIFVIIFCSLHSLINLAMGQASLLDVIDIADVASLL